MPVHHAQVLFDQRIESGRFRFVSTVPSYRLGALRHQAQRQRQYSELATGLRQSNESYLRNRSSHSADTQILSSFADIAASPPG
jgi:hypothetical protein